MVTAMAAVSQLSARQNPISTALPTIEPARPAVSPPRRPPLAGGAAAGRQSVIRLRSTLPAAHSGVHARGHGGDAHGVPRRTACAADGGPAGAGDGFVADGDDGTFYAATEVVSSPSTWPPGSRRGRPSRDSRTPTSPRSPAARTQDRARQRRRVGPLTLGQDNRVAGAADPLRPGGCHCRAGAIRPSSWSGADLSDELSTPTAPRAGAARRGWAPPRSPPIRWAGAGDRHPRRALELFGVDPLMERQAYPVGARPLQGWPDPRPLRGLS